MPRSRRTLIYTLGVAALVLMMCAVALGAVCLARMKGAEVAEATPAIASLTARVPVLTATPVTYLPATPTAPPSLTPTPTAESPSQATISPTPLAQIPATPTASTEPPASLATIPPSGEEVSLELFEDFDLVPGQVAQLKGTDIQVLLVEAHGPLQDCFDCPNTATLMVSLDGEASELSYCFSGNMAYESLQKARRKAAFGLVFIAMRIAEDSFTIRVEPDTQ